LALLGSVVTKVAIKTRTQNNNKQKKQQNNRLFKRMFLGKSDQSPLLLQNQNKNKKTTHKTIGSLKEGF
jgi:hypothetical protein